VFIYVDIPFFAFEILDSISMTEKEEKLHRTWTQLLHERGRRELASIAVESEVEVEKDRYGEEWIVLRLPPSAHGIVTEQEEVSNELLDYLHDVCAGNIYDQNGEAIRDVRIEVKMSLLEVEEDWKEEMRRLISSAPGSNQGVVTEKEYGREGKDTVTYNEMTFASKSEVRVAQEFETREVLFFPLPLGIRTETGTRWKDHKEPDFLVCQDGTWGVLEVAYHPDRYEQDAEKAKWYKEAGILCVEYFTAERCYNEPEAVVDDFLNVLSKHRG
jgi:hypothetical protein